MGWLLRYGVDLQGELELDERVLVVEDGTCWPEPPPPLAECVAKALENPLGFPPLWQSIIPGDHVTLVLEEGLPHPEQVVQAVVQVLLAAQIAPEDITILCPAQPQSEPRVPVALLPEPIRRRIMLRRHDPADPGCLAYLASTEAGHRVLLHRAIVDADVVLPIGCQQSDQAPDYFGLFSGVYPAFSDLAAQRRFRAWTFRAQRGAEKRLLMAEVREVAWLLGSAFAIQLVPGPGQRIVEVLAGQIQQVGRASAHRYQAIWKRWVPRRARLVVAAIPGGPAEQTWQSLARALATAGRLVEPSGAIAVCSTLSQPPGQAIQALLGAKHPLQALKRLGPDLPDDTLQAVQILRTQRHARVFLLSHLEEQLVEALRLTPLGDFSQLAQLVRQAPSCIVLPEAQYAMVEVAPPSG